MLLVDSHCHLNFPDFREDLDAVLERARAAGVQVMQTICTEMEEFEEVLAIANRYDGVYCSVGVHPNESADKSKAELSQLLACSAHAKVIGIGETGLDYHYSYNSRGAQQESFLVHIEASRASGLPLIVHTREADEDTILTLEREKIKGDFPGVIHCFTSSQYLADKAIELGFYISISGIATFKSAQSIRDTIKTIPLERLLVETDAPYLAPSPHRGKRNEPAYTRFTNKLVAEVKHITEEECAVATTDNFFRLFSKARLPC